MIRHVLLSALLAILAVGCRPDVAETHLLVKVDGDASLIASLRRLEISTFPPDARAESKPLSRQTFDIQNAKAAFPLIAELEHSQDDRVTVVIKGFASSADDADASIEHKVVSSFRVGSTAWIRSYLFSECNSLPTPCTGLDRTCSPRSEGDTTEYGDCGAIDEIDASLAEPNGRPPLREAGSDNAESSCSNARLCTLSDYPCVDSVTTGYECQGQFAEWPMPSSPGDEHGTPARYTVDAVAGSVRDEVTGLLWQRTTPRSYAFCSGKRWTAGSTCTWEEAKRYCSELQLAGGGWRLPTKIEMESLIVEDGSIPAFHSSFGYFLHEGLQDFLLWTASPFIHDDFPDHAWYVNTGLGVSDFEDKRRLMQARCVRSTTIRRGTPAGRYLLDPDADTVTDKRTRLRWQRSVGPAFADVGAAHAYCKEQGARVPSRKELLTLTDPSRPPPAIDPIFADTKKLWLWTRAENQLLGAGSHFVFAQPLGVVADNETVARGDSSTEFYVRCVSDPND